MKTRSISSIVRNRCLIILTGMALPLSFAAGSAQAETSRPRVLLLTGANNHNWAATTPILQQLLASTGAFDVDIVTEPETLVDKLDDADVLLSNWNATGKENKPPPWSEALKTAYVEFVRAGGGHVAVHAGTSSFSNWPDYQAIGLASWKNKETSHGPVDTFDVRITDPSHPVTQGMTAFQTRDELWLKPGVQPGARVIAEAFSTATGNWEPSVLVGEFGQGRCLTILLGHDANAMNNEGFRQLLLQGTSWAAGATP